MSGRENKEKPKTNDGGQLTDRSDQPDRTDPTDNNARNDTRPMRLRPSGGYRQLRSFQTTTIIYDATVSFCQRFVDKRSRLIDQMVQAARSGRQNIAEGSRASATSSQTELRLVNVARASLDELLLDYEDFLRQRKLGQWQKDDPQAKAVREVGKNPTDQSDQTDRSDYAAYSRWLDSADPAVVANAVICLIHQANFLLDRQIAGLEKQFVQEGGYSEQLYAARLKERKSQVAPSKSNPTDRSDQTEKKICPACGRPMLLRTARKGANAGAQFWGCSGYPECKGVRSKDGSDRSDRSDRDRK